MAKTSATKKSKSKSKSASKSKPTVGRTGFDKTVLDNGITVITERHPTNRAVSCGVWVDKGTRHESSEEAGLAHFVEHLVFKRTKNRSAYEIARDMEAVGGDLNAFTSRENTCFLTHALAEHVGLSLDVLSDLVCRPSFDPGDIKKEKQVVIQEILMSEDQLEDAIFDKFYERIYPDHPLGKPILGTSKSIEEMSRKRIVDFHERQYGIEHVIVSIAGQVDHAEVVALTEKFMGSEAPSAPKRKGSVKAGLVKESRKEHVEYAEKQLARMRDERPVPPKATPFREVVKKSSEQVHILIGHPTLEFRDPMRFDAVVVNTMLGGGMTSRLYQTVREERGLVYSVFSSLNTYSDSGTNLIYAGTEPKKAPTVIELILKELKRLKREGMTRDEIEFYKRQVKGSILLGADDIENRMNSLAVNEMMFGKYRSVDDVIADVDAVNFDSVHDYIQRKMDIETIGMLLMGPLPEAATTKWLNSL
ncbi:MAG: pitrilysin family protein [Bdellovibrionota bacterium]